eukprot:185802-Pleurochrysis_carterae.AAC.1
MKRGAGETERSSECPRVCSVGLSCEGTVSEAVRAAPMNDYRDRKSKVEAQEERRARDEPVREREGMICSAQSSAHNIHAQAHLNASKRAAVAVAGVRKQVRLLVCGRAACPRTAAPWLRTEERERGAVHARVCRQAHDFTERSCATAVGDEAARRVVRP